VINLFIFFSRYKSPPFHTVIRIHLISLSCHILVFFLQSHLTEVFCGVRQLKIIAQIDFIIRYINSEKFNIVFVECKNNIEDFISMQSDPSCNGQIVDYHTFIDMFCSEL